MYTRDLTGGTAALDESRAVPARGGESRVPALRATTPRLHGERGLRRIVVKRATHLVFLRTEDIDWIESARNYVRLHANGEAHMIRQPIGALEALLDPDRFLRIHRSTIVNADRIREMRARAHGNTLVVLDDGTRLTLSATYRRRIARLWESAWRAETPPSGNATGASRHLRTSLGLR